MTITNVAAESVESKTNAEIVLTHESSEGIFLECVKITPIGLKLNRPHWNIGYNFSNISYSQTHIEYWCSPVPVMIQLVPPLTNLPLSYVGCH